MGIIKRDPQEVIAAVTAQQQAAISRQASGLQIVASAIPPTGIDGTDFKTTGSKPRRSMGILYGRTGMGKTHFVTHFIKPRIPLAYISMDGRAEEVVNKARQRLGRTIYLADCFVPGEVLSMSHEEAQKHGQMTLEMVMRNLRWAVRKAREEEIVIAIEHAPELEEAIKLAVRGRVDRPAITKDDKGDYGKSDNLINTQVNAIAAMGRQSGAHFIMLGRAKEIYNGRDATGRFSCLTHWRFQESADWIMEVRRTGDVTVTGKKIIGQAQASGQPEWELEVTKSGNDDEGVSQLFQVYTEREWTSVGGPFVWAMLNLYPGSTVEDWI